MLATLEKLQLNRCHAEVGIGVAVQRQMDLYKWNQNYAEYPALTLPFKALISCIDRIVPGPDKACGPLGATEAIERICDPMFFSVEERLLKRTLSV